MFCTNAGWDQYLKNIDMLRGLGRATYRCRVTSLNRGMRGKGELVSVDADLTSPTWPSSCLIGRLALLFGPYSQSLTT